MANGYKTGGRQKGTPNRVTATAREAIALAADALGGYERMVAWAQESPDNEKAFWVSIYPKIVAVQTELTGPDGGPVQNRLEVIFRDAGRVPGEA